MAAVDRLVTALADRPLTARELADTLGVPSGRLPLAQLKREGLATKVGGRWRLTVRTCDVPDEPRDMAIDQLMRRNRGVCP